MVKDIQFLSVFLVGILIGSLGHWYFSFKLPEVEAYKAAMEEQNRINDMVYTGFAVEVNAKDMLLQVSKEDKKENGEVIHVHFSDYTTIQEGMRLMKEPSEELDLTKYIRPGQYVTVMIDDGDALALHFDRFDDVSEPDSISDQD